MNAGHAVPTAPSPLERQQLQVADPRNQTFWHRIRFELTCELALAHGSSTLLDVGAGSGLLGDHVLSSQPRLRYRFEELSPLLDDALTRRFGVDRRSTPDAAIGADTTVAMLDVVEHIADDRAALSELARRMAPAAQLVVTVPALGWAFSSWDEALGHHRRYSRRGLRSVLTDAGFVVDRVEYLFPELLPLLVARTFRTAPREHVDFPQIGPAATRAGYALGSLTTRLRRLSPAGTSVIAVARVPGAR